MEIQDPNMIQQFEELVNRLLINDSHMEAIETAVHEQMSSVNPEIIGSLLKTFQQALKPTNFSDQRIIKPDERFKATYALLEYSFDEAERDSYERFQTMLNNLASPYNDHPIIMLDRCAKVSGLQQYDEAGRLRHFTYAPNEMTEFIISLIEGNYMSLVRASSVKESIGAIGHIVTREHFRNGQGHGSNLLRSFESEIVSEAQKRGEVVRLFALEAQADSQGFWYKAGYRWVHGTNYAQPPLDFDPITGAPLHLEVPETLMVKISDQPDATAIDITLIKDAVKMMYENWCIEKAAELGPTVLQVARNYVFGKVYREFCESLPSSGSVALTAPPLLD